MNRLIIMLSLEQLTQEVLSLPGVERAKLADILVESLDFDPDIQAVWISESQKRRDEILGGQVKPIDGDEALAQVRQLLDS